MAQNNTLQTSLDTFGQVAKQENVTPEALMVALFQHALTSQRELSPKASKRAIRGHWGVKVQYRDKTRTMPLAKHYEFVTSKLKSFTGETDGSKVLDRVIAEGSLIRTRANWIGTPGAFTTEPTREASADDVL